MLYRLRLLVNHPGRTTKTLLDFGEVVGGAASSDAVRKVLEMFGAWR